MRFVKGITLSQKTRRYHEARVARRADPVGLIKLLGALVGVSNAIAYAHLRGFIHRDLKGQNIVMGDFGEVIVLDWGLARRIELPSKNSSGYSASESSESLELFESSRIVVAENSVECDVTLSLEQELRESWPDHPQVEARAKPERTIQGQILGTPAYMAPEQAEGSQKQTDARTDVYGLGAILYEILTGQPPFHAKTTKELLRKVRREPPKSPRQINPEVPAPLETICLKALAKVPAERYDSAAELAREVQRYLADEPVLAYAEPWPRRATRWARNIEHWSPVQLVFFLRHLLLSQSPPCSSLASGMKRRSRENKLGRPSTTCTPRLPSIGWKISSTLSKKRSCKRLWIIMKSSLRVQLLRWLLASNMA